MSNILKSAKNYITMVISSGSEIPYNPTSCGPQQHVGCMLYVAVYCGVFPLEQQKAVGKEEIVNFQFE